MRLTLYVVESNFLAARMDTWLHNTGRVEGTKYRIFVTQGPLFTTDLKPIKNALENESLCFPRNLTLVPGKNANLQARLKNLKELASKAGEIYWISFPSAEAELSFQTCINYLKVSKKSRRVLLSALTGNAFNAAFARKPQNHELSDLYNAAYTRSIADAWFGMNVSFWIASFASPLRAHIAAGRLQWPVLQVINRIVNQPEHFGVITLRDHRLNRRVRFYDLPFSNTENGLRLKFKQVKKTLSTAGLYTAETLIPDIIEMLDSDHETAVKHLHLLFESACITWPWTSVSWLPAQFRSNMKERVAQWAVFLKQIELPPMEHWNADFYKLHQSARQYGIMPVKVPVDQLLLPVFRLIAERFLQAHTGEEREFVLSFASLDANGKELNTSITGKSRSNDFAPEEVVYFKLEYLPPRRQTDRNTVLKTLANIGEAKGQLTLWDTDSEYYGLGRAANRNNILNKLISNHYIQEIESDIQITEIGMELLEKLGKSPLFDPQCAYAFEQKLRSIESGSLHPEIFLHEWQQFLLAEIEQLKEDAGSLGSITETGGAYRSKVAMWNAIRKLDCPKCKATGIKVEQDKIECNACNWILSAIQKGRRIPWNQLYRLLHSGSTQVLKKNAITKNTDTYRQYKKEKKNTRNSLSASHEITAGLNAKKENIWKGRFVINSTGEVCFQPVD